MIDVGTRCVKARPSRNNDRHKHALPQFEISALLLGQRGGTRASAARTQPHVCTPLFALTAHARCGSNTGSDAHTAEAAAQAAASVDELLVSTAGDLRSDAAEAHRRGDYMHALALYEEALSLLGDTDEVCNSSSVHHLWCVVEKYVWPQS
jgi:hypothetical protein